jgi:glycosyltransferase involved in cell wall biosynthesis
VHVNDALAAPFTPFVPVPAVMTLHHPHDPALSALYMRHQAITYVAISEHQRRRESMRRMRMVHHGIRVESYRFERRKQDYLVFIGRIAPLKGAHLAIEVARQSGIPLKIAGEIQPVFREYWEREVAPHVDGSFIEYVGEADFALKNDLLASARALLFPIQWDEPFGLVMIEAMACGTPVLALPGGAVSEVVENGVSGHVCPTVEELARRAADPAIDPLSCRAYVASRFHVEGMVRRYERLFKQLTEDPRSGHRPVPPRSRRADAGLAAAAG